MTQVSERGVGTRLGEVTGASSMKYDRLGRRITRAGTVRGDLPKAESWSWRTRAACHQPGIDPDWFWSNTTSDIVAALTVCETCPVRSECGAEQARIEAPGVWGGVRWVEKSGEVYPDKRPLLVESPAKRNRRVRRRRVLVLTLRGMKAPQVADVLGFHRQTVKNDLKALGF